VLIGKKYLYELYGGIRSSPTVFIIDRQGRVYGKGFWLAKTGYIGTCCFKIIRGVA